MQTKSKCFKRKIANNNTCSDLHIMKKKYKQNNVIICRVKRHIQRIYKHSVIVYKYGKTIRKK